MSPVTSSDADTRGGAERPHGAWGLSISWKQQQDALFLPFQRMSSGSSGLMAPCAQAVSPCLSPCVVFSCGSL